MASQEMPADTRPHRTSAGFPLASLALFVTAFACLLACVDIDRWRNQFATLAVTGIWQLVLVFGGAAVFGAVVGLLFALLRRANCQTTLFAPFVGILAGEAGVSILLAPAAVWRTMIAVTVLLGTVMLLRVDTD
jgi:hypothetical protein